MAVEYTRDHSIPGYASWILAAPHVHTPHNQISTAEHRATIAISCRYTLTVAMICGLTGDPLAQCSLSARDHFYGKAIAKEGRREFETVDFTYFTCSW